MKQLALAVLMLSSVAVAANPPVDDERAERKEQAGKKVHMLLVVGIADALGLSEAEALRMSDKLKGYEQKRRPVRETMVESLRTLKAAAEGEAGSLAQVDGAVQRLFDSRQQMAAMDKEMFAGLSKDLTPQRRAQLAVFLARFHAEGRGWKGGKGRHRRN